jgi:hypothetical protein
MGVSTTFGQIATDLVHPLHPLASPTPLLRLPGVQDRALTNLETRFGGYTRLADHQFLLAVRMEHANGVVGVIGQVDHVVAINEIAVRTFEDALAPGIQKLSVLVEQDDGMLATIEDMDPIAGVDCDAGNFDEGPALGQLLPPSQVRTAVAETHRSRSASHSATELLPRAFPVVHRMALDYRY